MVKFVIGAILFGLIAVSVIVLLVINFTYRSVKKLRQELEDNYYRNQKQKEQKERNPFRDDYFKGSKSGRPKSRTQAQYEEREQIDDRDQERKIFDHSDGEYVEFEEV